MSKRQKTIEEDIENNNYDDAAATLMSLPNDVRVNIAIYLPFKAIIRLSIINKSFNEWSTTNSSLWLMLYNRNFGDELPFDELKQKLQMFFPSIVFDDYRSLVLAYTFINHNQFNHTTLFNMTTISIIGILHAC